MGEPDTGMSVEQQIVAAIRRIVRAVDLHSRHLLDSSGLTGPQIATLQALAGVPGGASPTTIARTVHLSQATVTGILKRLERRGLIARRRSETDGRAAVIEITAEGARVLEHAPSLLQERFRQELERLQSWERHQILATLQRVAQLMDAERLDASPYLVSGALDSPAAPSGEQ
ncbi:MAG: MarR family transcriptional regulator [Phycisphaerales bacterium]|nr:MarR family transcriptional regulator [Phycisphaerales bacterium]